MLQLFATGLLNKIVVGAITAIGLIFQQGAGIPATTPAWQIWDSAKQDVMTTNFQGDLTASGTGLFRTALRGAGLTDCDTAGTAKLLWDASTGQFSCGTDTDTDTDTTYTTGQGLTLIGTTIRLNDTLTGSVVKATTTLASSGTLVFEGAASGSSLYLGTSLAGAGLTDCDTAGTSKLLWDATSGRFSCGTDQTGGGGGSFSTGNVLTIGNQKYVSKQGDTMTGALTINMQNGTLGTLGLKVLNTLSGAIIHAEKALTSSGSVTTNSGYLLSAARNQVIRMLMGNSTGKTLDVQGSNGSGGYAGGTINIEAGTSLRTVTPAAPGASPAFVQIATASATATPASVSPTWGVATTAGNLLVAIVSIRSPGPSAVASSIVPPAGLGWTLVTSTTTNYGNGGGRGYIAMYYIENAPSQSGAHAWSWSNAAYMMTISAQVNMLEYSGIDTSGSLDVFASAVSPNDTGGSFPYTTDTTADSGTTSATSQANELVIAAMSTQGQALGAPSNSFIERRDGATLGAHYVEVADLVLTTTGTPNTASTYSSATVSLGVIATFKYSPTGGPATARVSNAGILTLNSGSGSNPTIKIGNKYGAMIQMSQGTGAVVINGTDAKRAKLNVVGTISGALLILNGDGRYLGNLSSSGTVLANGSIKSRSTLSGAALTIMNGNSFMMGRLGLGFTGTPDTKFEVLGSMSGSSLQVTGSGARPLINARAGNPGVSLFSNIISEAPTLVVGPQNVNANQEGGEVRLLGADSGGAGFNRVAFDNYRGSFRVISNPGSGEISTAWFGSGGLVGIGSAFYARATLDVHGSMSGHSLTIGGFGAPASVSHATCWRANGLIGYCSSAIDASGICTCN